MMLRGVHRAFRRTGADDGVQFVNEQNDVFRAADFVHDRLDALLKLAAIFRAGDHQREIERDDALVRAKFPARCPCAISCARPSTMAVLPTPASPSSTGLFFVRRQRIWMTRSISFFAADDRIHVALARDFRQVAAKRLERGRFDFALFLRRRGFLAAASAGMDDSSPVKFGIQFLQNFLARLLDVHVEIFQNLRGHAVAFAQQAEQNVFRADVSVIERLGLLRREREHFFHARRVGNVADHLLVRAGADLFLDFHADGFEVEAHFLQDIHGHALAQFDQAEQKMLGAEEIVVEPVGFLARQREHLLRARRKIAHGFIAHTCIIMLYICQVCPIPSPSRLLVWRLAG